MLVAGHRGVRVGAPENTMEAFLMAIEAGVDMIETDTHMTTDGVIILMHDDTVDRTTSGTGRIRDLTYEEIKAIGPDVPTLREFLEAMKPYPTLEFNFELKDYPEKDEEWAWESMRKTIAMVEEFGLGDKCVINSFSGQLLEKVDEEYNHRYKLHGFYPLTELGAYRGEPMKYMFCACIFDETTVARQSMYDELTAAGVEPWIGAGVKTKEDLLESHKRGARLVTTDNPAETIRFLKELGIHG